MSQIRTSTTITTLPICPMDLGIRSLGDLVIHQGGGLDMMRFEPHALRNIIIYYHYFPQSAILVVVVEHRSQIAAAYNLHWVDCGGHVQMGAPKKWCSAPILSPHPRPSPALIPTPDTSYRLHLPLLYHTFPSSPSTPTIIKNGLTNQPSKNKLYNPSPALHSHVWPPHPGRGILYIVVPYGNGQ